MIEDTREGRSGLPVGLESELTTALQEAGVSEATRSKIIAVFQTGISQHNYHFPDGPWVSKDIAEALDDIDPGFARQYAQLLLARMTLSLRQGEHEIEWEKTEQLGQRTGHRLGLLAGVVLALSMVGGAVFCAFIGQKEVGLALVGASALGLIPHFVNSWRKKPNQ